VVVDGWSGREYDRVLGVHGAPGLHFADEETLVYHAARKVDRGKSWEVVLVEERLPAAGA
jgi:hypothetical protein